MKELGQESTAFLTQVSRPPSTLTRYALTTLVGRDQLWVVFMIFSPVLMLILSLYLPFLAASTLGIPLVICIWLIFLSHEFLNCQTRIDISNSTFTKTRPYSDEHYPPIQAEDISTVSILEFQDVALVRIRMKNIFRSKIPAVIVDPSDAPELKSKFESMDVDVSYQQSQLGISLVSLQDIRVWGTPVIIVSTFVLATAFHGIEPFESSAFVMPLIVILFILIYRAIIRP